jgi:SlyX protein
MAYVMTFASKGKPMDRIENLEERIAHLTRAVEDLSDVVARQSREIERLTRVSQLLAQREAERESDGGGGIPLADQKPPHW